MKIINIVKSYEYETDELIVFLESPWGRKLIDEEYDQLNDQSVFKEFKNSLKSYANGPDGPYGDARFRLYQQSHDLISGLGNRSRAYDLNDCFLDSAEVEIYLLKAAHRERTIRSLADKFKCSTTTIDNKRSELLNGTRIAGMEVRMSNLRHDDKLYSSVHPVVLPLNLSQVYILIRALKTYGEKFKSYDGHRIASDELADEIYYQLSEYAKNALGNSFDEGGFEFKESVTPTYVDDASGYYQKLMLEKKGCLAVFDTDEGRVEGYPTANKRVEDVLDDKLPDDGAYRMVIRLKDGGFKVVKADDLVDWDEKKHWNSRI